MEERRKFRVTGEETKGKKGRRRRGTKEIEEES